MTMETSRRFKNYQIVMTILFAALFLGGMLWVFFKGDFEKPYITFALTGVSFLLSLFFIGKSAKRILIPIALACAVAADYFLVFSELTATNQLIGICLFCGTQAALMIYTLFLNKSNGRRVINIATRVALCLIAYFVLPLYFPIGTLEIIAVMYVINFVVTLGVVALHIKREWLLFIGLLLYLICDIALGLSMGALLLGLGKDVVAILNMLNLTFWAYYPGLFFIALSSVFANKRNKYLDGKIN